VIDFTRASGAVARPVGFAGAPAEILNSPINPTVAYGCIVTIPSFLSEVVSEPERCPYRKDQTALMPLHLSPHRLTGRQVDEVLAGGLRRSGEFLYTTRCPSCSACEPTRVAVSEFQPSRSQRRVRKRAGGTISLQVDVPSVDDRRVDLFNRHRNVRNLARDDRTIRDWEYESFLIYSCCEVLEVTQWHDEVLIGVSILDVGEESLSMVYTYFDPDYSKYSPGTLAILMSLEIAKLHNKTWLYLGMFVADCPHLSYKDRFLPQQRRIEGKWVDIRQ